MTNDNVMSGIMSDHPHNQIIMWPNLTPYHY